MRPHDATRKNRDKLLSLPGVTGVHTGFKEQGGITTTELAIVASVEKKGDVPKEQRIPKTMNGVPTDVIEETIIPMVDATRYDPIQPGASFGPVSFGGGGTIGLLVTDNLTLEPAILSNYHVIYKDGSGFDGDAQVQPGAEDGGTFETDIVGRALRGMITDEVDCALASVFGRQLNPDILDIGAVTTLASPTVSDAVSKRGRTSGLTTGTVLATDASIVVTYPAPIGPKTFHNQIRFGGLAGMMIPGDSGSALLDSGGSVVGLCFAGTPSGSIGFANRMEEVFFQLEISLYDSPSGILLNGDDVEGLVSSVDINMDGSHLADWEIYGQIILLHGDSDVTIAIAEDEGLTDAFSMRFTGFDADDTQSFEITTPTGSDTAGSESYEIWVPITFQLRWGNGSHTLTGIAQQNGILLQAMDIVTGTPSLSAPYHPVIKALGTGDYIAQINKLQVGRECGALPPGLDWTEDFATSGSWVLLSDAHWTSDGAGGVTAIGGGSASIDPIVSGDLPDFVVTGYLELANDSYSVEFTVASDNGGFSLDFTFGGSSFAITGPLVGNRFLILLGFGSDDGNYTDQDLSSMIPGVPIDFVLTVNPTATTVTLDLTQGSSNWTLTHNDTDWFSESSDTSAAISAFFQPKNNTITGECVASVQDVSLL